MTINNGDLLNLDEEAKKATSRVFSLLKETQKLSEDDLFTEALAWAAIISLYMESMEGDPEGKDMQIVFESIAKSAKDRFHGVLNNSLEDALEEKKNAQGK